MFPTVYSVEVHLPTCAEDSQALTGCPTRVRHEKHGGHRMFLYAVSRRVCQPRSGHTLRAFSCTTSNSYVQWVFFSFFSRKDRLIESLVSEYAAQIKKGDAFDQGTTHCERSSYFSEPREHPEESTPGASPSYVVPRSSTDGSGNIAGNKSLTEERGEAIFQVLNVALDTRISMNWLVTFFCTNLQAQAENDDDYVDFDSLGVGEEDMTEETRAYLEKVFSQGAETETDSFKSVETEVSKIFRQAQDASFDPSDAGTKQFSTYDFAVLEKQLEASGEFASKDTEYDPNWTDEQRALREEIDAIKARIPEGSDDPEIDEQIERTLAEEEEMKEAISKLLPGSNEDATSVCKQDSKILTYWRNGKVCLLINTCSALRRKRSLLSSLDSNYKLGAKLSHM